MSNIGSTTGPRATGGFGTALRAAGSKISDGLSSIGGKFAQFGGAVSSLFKGIGQRIAGLGAHGAAGGTTPPAAGASFTADEKRTHMDAALASPTFTAAANSTTPNITADALKGYAREILTMPGAVAAMKAHGLSLEEATAVRVYTGALYVPINEGLRNGSQKPEITSLAAAFTSGLAKLPSYQGNAVQVNGNTYHQCFRGAMIPRAAADGYMIGNAVTERGIMSTTTDRSASFPDANFDIQVLLKPGSAGKDVAMFSVHPEESEVAFPPGTTFTIADRRIDSGGLADLATEQRMHPMSRKEGAAGNMRADLVMVEV